MSNTQEGIHSRITEAEERINDLEDRMVEIAATEQNIEKRKQRNKDSLRVLWDSIKCNNICFRRVPEGEEKGKERERRDRKKWEIIWRDNSWKPPKGNSQSSLRSTESPKQEHTKEQSNETDKTKDTDKIL